MYNVGVPILNCYDMKLTSHNVRCDNESTTGADASAEALKLYHMKLTLAYSSLLALHASDSNSLPEYKKWEMIAVIVAKKVLNPQMGVPVCNDCC